MVIVALETDQVMMNVPKHVGLPETQEFSWKLNCVIWAHVDQQDKKKSFAKADSEVLREHSLQVSNLPLCIEASHCYSCIKLQCI